MATFLRSPPSLTLTLSSSSSSRRLCPPVSSSSKLICFSFPRTHLTFGPSCRPVSLKLSNTPKIIPFSAADSSLHTDVIQDSDIQNSEQEISDAAAAFVEDVVEDSASDDDNIIADEISDSAVIISLRSYKEALANNDESKLTEIEAFIKSIEDEKSELEVKVTTLSEELSTEKTKILRISADFDNFRKRTDRERLSLVSNAQGEVVENLLSVLDNFERAKSQIKVETEGEQKIVNNYQSIYKQFTEILGSLGVVPVETVKKPFDPLLHEAIMREDSDEFEEGIVLEEFRKGFKLGDRLLRPSMVKVSAGPGPANSESVVEAEIVVETSEEGSSAAGDEESCADKP